MLVYAGDSQTRQWHQAALTTGLLIAISTLSVKLSETEWATMSGLSSLPLAIVLGMLSALIISPSSATSEQVIRFCQQKLLRTGIVLLGFGITLEQVVATGWSALLADSIIILVVITSGITVGVRYLGLTRPQAALISMGSAICGAAAILASESSVKASKKEVTIAMTTVVLFGTMALLLYPLLYRVLGLPDDIFGVFIGSTAHEVAQAVAAGQALGPEVLQTALTTKLLRVLLLAPALIGVTIYLKRQLQKDSPEAQTNRSSAALPVPWFILLFILAVVVNSSMNIPVVIQHQFQAVSQIALTVAMAALGLNTRLSCIKTAGFRPFILGTILFVLLMTTGISTALVSHVLSAH